MSLMSTSKVRRMQRMGMNGYAPLRCHRSPRHRTTPVLTQLVFPRFDPPREPPNIDLHDDARPRPNLLCR